MNGSVRLFRQYCESRRLAAEPPGICKRPPQGLSLFGRLLAQLLQEFRELAFGRLLERIEDLFLAFGGFDVARVAVRDHEIVVRRLAAWLEFGSLFEERDGLGVALGIQARFPNGEERCHK